MSEKQALINFLRKKTTTFTFDEVGQIINIVTNLQERGQVKPETPEETRVVNPETETESKPSQVEKPKRGKKTDEVDKFDVQK